MNKWVIENYDYLVGVCKALVNRNKWFGSPDDLTQEVIVRLLNAKSSLIVVGNHAYAFAIARNIIRDEYRKRKIRRIVAHPTSLADVVDPTREPEFTPEDVQRMRKYMKSLTESQRQIILMRGEGLSFAEISQLLKIPLKTLHTKLFRARNALEAQTMVRRKRNQSRKK